MTAQTAHIELQSSHTWWSRLADSCIVLMLLWLTFPETLFGELYLGPLPAEFLIFYIASLCLGLDSFIRSDSGSSLRFLFWASAMLMTVYGVLRGGELKWIVIDFSVYLGLLTGLNFVCHRTQAELIRLLRRIVLGVMTLAMLTLLGLSAGVIAPARESGRVYVYAVLRAAEFLALLLPLIAVSTQVAPLRKLPQWTSTALVLFGYACIFSVAFFTATRSIFATGAISCLLLGRILFQRRLGHLLIFCLAVTAFAALWSEFGWQTEGPLLIEERLDWETIRRHEPRLIEARMLLDQIDGHEWAIGMGFGSRFHSPVIVDGIDLAISPHIGVLTPLQKGGLPLFLLMIAFPAIGLLARFASRMNPIQLAWIAGALIYLQQSSLSAGWDFYRMFLYGVCLAAMWIFRFSGASHACSE